MTCGERDNVIAHLDKMESINQALSGRGCVPDDEDSPDTIIHSLPQSYQNLLTALMAVWEEIGTPTTPT